MANAEQPVRVDGSFGEGGGQILRTSLSLSAITGRPFTIENIRLNRKPPGLRPQHLLSVTSTGEVCGARVSGAEVGAREISFEPAGLKSGTYRFEVGTAGATALVLQTLFFPLAFAPGESRVAITGGTHVPMSPCYHYLAMQWLPTLRRIGFEAEVAMAKSGFFPRGGGEIRSRISPQRRLGPLHLLERGPLKQIVGISAISNLPMHIAERQRDRAVSRLRAKDLDAAIQIIQMPSPGKGTMLLLFAEFEQVTSCHFSLGAIGKRAEKVADEACDEFLEFLSVEAAIERHLADQVLVPLALLQGESVYTTDKITPHLLTNAEIVTKFLDVEIGIEGEPGRPGKVALRSHGLARRAE